MGRWGPEMVAMRPYMGARKWAEVSVGGRSSMLAAKKCIGGVRRFKRWTRYVLACWGFLKHGGFPRNKQR